MIAASATGVEYDVPSYSSIVLVVASVSAQYALAVWNWQLYPSCLFHIDCCGAAAMRPYSRMSRRR